MQKYEVIEACGSGAYGMVFKAVNSATGEQVAIKKFKESDEDDIVRKTTLREVKMLRMLRQENIVDLKEAFRRKRKLYLVFEYIEHTLLQVLEASPGGLPPEAVRRYIWQLVRALRWCHGHGVVHRDIKPENLLIKPAQGGGGAPGAVGQLKLCDFGFARVLPPSPGDASITDYVSTRWYRAPELLLGSSHYSKEVDVWAVGCIMAELSDGAALFPGDSDIDQLYIVQRMLGPLCRAHDILFLKSSRFAGVKFPDMGAPETLERHFGAALPPATLSFLK
ncbi:MAG: flagellar associated protein [Monoraphidium minutum]|nr:MAG: flagellar associated protein [Monoraphidium minutum]